MLPEVEGRDPCRQDFPSTDRLCLINNLFISPYVCSYFYVSCRSQPFPGSFSLRRPYSKQLVSQSGSRVFKDYGKNKVRYLVPACPTETNQPLHPPPPPPPPTSHLERAAATHCGCSSEITPFPIGVGRNGKLNFSINLVISNSAQQYAAPIYLTSKHTTVKKKNIYCIYTFPKTPLDWTSK